MSEAMSAADRLLDAALRAQRAQDRLDAVLRAQREADPSGSPIGPDGEAR